MKYSKRYYDTVSQMLNQIMINSGESCNKAAALLAETVQKDHLIHIFGAGMHSTLAAEDVVYRQGNLVGINGIYDPSFSVTHGASRSLYISELEMCGTFLMEYYRNLSAGDVLIVVDESGKGNACCETVLKAKELGLKVILIYSEATRAAADFKETLVNAKAGDILAMVDVAIDNCVPAHDVALPDIPGGGGWLSTIANSYLLNLIFLETCAEIPEADRWHDFHTVDGLEKNENMIEKYFDRIKHI